MQRNSTKRTSGSPGPQTISGNVVDLHARRIFPGTVTWSDGVIRRVEPTPGRRYAHYIAPGFVDAHIHIESSMLPPSEFARIAVVHGTVATVSDPHEIANVLGAAGVDLMIRDGARTALKFTFGAPSCVPATDQETSGACLDERAVDRLLRRREVRYLSEFMNYPAVLARDPSAMAKIQAAHRRGKPVDGHAPGLRGADAAHYAAAGISTDHECFTLDEARDKVAAGMKILIREGSAARNFEALEPLISTHPERCMFCCDDLHPDRLVEHHIDHHVRRALQAGHDRIDVLRCASVNPVTHYGLPVGLLRVGDPADLIVFRGWKNLRVLRTYLDGDLVATRGRSLLPRLEARTANRFRVRPRRPEEFRVPATARDVRVIEAINGQIVTRAATLPARIVDGLAEADPARDLLKIAVVNRYTPHPRVAVGFVRGFGLRSGAIASSVAHDSHNIVAVGASDEALAEAVNLVIKSRGGISVAGGPTGSAVLPLPIAGLMATDDARKVARRYARLEQRARSLGSSLDSPFMTLSFMALLVIPELKMSDRGLFSAASWSMVPVFE